MFTKNNVKQDSASGEKVGDIEKIFVKTYLNYNCITLLDESLGKKITMTSSL